MNKVLFYGKGISKRKIMQLKKRIIARLDIKGSKLIKGIRFEGLRVIGEPYKAALKYYQDGIDEIFYSDAVASLYGRNSLDDILRKTCKNIFVPITAGGAVKSVEDCNLLLRAGADKIAINSYAVKDPDLISSLALRFGEQCIVLSIQARKSKSCKSGYEVMIESGRQKTGIDVIEWIKKTQKMGIGEIFLTSVDNDGTKKGPDLDLLNLIDFKVQVPLIFGGGFGQIKEVETFLNSEKISGISIGTALHKNDLKIKDLINITSSKGINLEESITNNLSIDDKFLKGIEVVVVDYGMGNQLSLINALENIGAIVNLTYDPEIVYSAKVVILPGVGSFPCGMEELQKRNLKEILIRRFKEKKPIIGICLGMQLFFKRSSEFSNTEGLGFFDSEVIHLKDHIEIKNKINSDKTELDIKLPHVGWNVLVESFGKSKFFSTNLFLDKKFYFVHNYGVRNCHNLDFYLRTSYKGIRPLALCEKNSGVGFQFHPERSGISGLLLLGNLLKKMYIN